MNYLIFLDTQSPLWDYVPNRQWLEARSMQIVRTNQTTAHAVLIESNETLQEVHDAMGDTLCNVDSFEVIPLTDPDGPVLGSNDATLRRWLSQRGDWKAWLQKHKF